MSEAAVVPYSGDLRVVVLEDHPLIRDALLHELESIFGNVRALYKGPDVEAALASMADERADIVLLDSLEECRVSDVVTGGRLVVPELFAAREPVEPVGLASMKARESGLTWRRSVTRSGPAAPCSGPAPRALPSARRK